MIINEIYVGGFGKLHDFRLSFSEGLCETLAENGYGKSTVAAFISAMLYGLDDTRSQKLDENPRKKYTPWGTDVFGGYMVFTTDKGTFRCERSFGKKASVNFDTFTLIYLETGKESTAYSEKLGQDIFGIDEDGFLRSAYLSERSLSEKNQNPTISAKISKISLADADMGGYEAAEKLLDERRKFYQKRGGGGEIRDTESEASLYEGKIAAIKAKQGAADGIKKELAEVSARIEELKRQADEYKASGRALDELEKKRLLRERYSELISRERDLIEEEDKLLSFFGGITPSGEDIRILSEAKAELEVARKTLISLKEKGCTFESEEPIKSESLSSALSELQRKRRAPTALMLSGLVSLAIGCALFSVLLPLGIGAAILGVLLTIVGLYKDLSYKKHSIENATLAIESAGGTLRTKTKADAEHTLSELIKAASEREKINSNQRSEALARSALIEEYEIKVKALSDKASGAAARLGIAPDTTPTEASETFARLSVTKKDRQRASEAARAFKASVGVDDSDAPRGVDSKEKIDYLIADTHNEIIEAERRRVMLEGELCALSEENERLYEYEDKLSELRERIVTLGENLSVISHTSRLLFEAKERLTARYLGSAREAFSKYCREFGLEGDFTLDTSFTLTKTELGKSRKAESFSRGTRDLFALTVRLALTDALFEGDYPPIILDDPFINLDDEKIESAKKIVTALSKSRQVIYFTCSESRKINR